VQLGSSTVETLLKRALSASPDAVSEACPPNSESESRRAARPPAQAKAPARLAGLLDTNHDPAVTRPCQAAGPRRAAQRSGGGEKPRSPAGGWAESYQESSRTLENSRERSRASVGRAVSLRGLHGAHGAADAELANHRGGRDPLPGTGRLHGCRRSSVRVTDARLPSDGRSSSIPEHECLHGQQPGRAPGGEKRCGRLDSRARATPRSVKAGRD
jgi:hypothetical protein